MIVYTYENYRGGVNNLCVAIDWRTGERAASTKGKEAAARNLRRRLRTIRHG